MKPTILTEVLIILCMCLISCTQPVYIEDNANQDTVLPTDPSTEPIEDDAILWEDLEGKFTFYDDGSIRLTDPLQEAGTATLISYQTQLRKTAWLFHITLSFNPSANNYMRIYLASSEQDVTYPLNGYFLQVGGEADDIGLYRQEGTDITLLAKTPELMKGDSSPTLSLSVEYDNMGYFTLSAVNLTPPAYSSVVSAQDTTFNSTAFCIVQCVYTKSRSRGFLIHSSRLHHRVPDRIELTPLTVE